MRRASAVVVMSVFAAFAAPAQATPSKQDATFLRSATSRALTEVNVATALLHLRGSGRPARSLASLVTRRSGHESRALIKLSAKEGVPPLATGKRRGTRQVQHLAKVSARHRGNSFAELLLSDLRSHLRLYDVEIAKGRDAQVRRQAREWRGRLADLLARARRLRARV